MIKVNKVTKLYTLTKGIHDIDFEITTPGVYALIGHNASGKTTLIKLLCGLLAPSHGEIKIDGVNKADDFFKVISYMPDSLEYPASLDISNISKFIQASHKDFDINKFNELLAKFKIESNEHYYNLSKGKKMAVRLALTISRDVPIYILDEPLSGIDVVTREMILSELLKSMREDKYFIISSHELHDIDNHIDDIIIMNNGRFEGIYNVDKLKNEENMSLHEWYLNRFSYTNQEEE